VGWGGVGWGVCVCVGGGGGGVGWGVIQADTQGGMG
jgi:hypothetical protein